MMLTSAVELVDLLASLVQEKKITLQFDPQKTKSNMTVAKLSKNAIMEFPVIASRSLSIEDLSMVSKALERQYTTYIRLAMSANDEIKSGMTKSTYMKQFHVNFNNPGDLSGNVGSKIAKSINIIRSESADIDYLEEELLFNETKKQDSSKKQKTSKVKNSTTITKDDSKPRNLARGRYLVTDPTKSPHKNQLIDNDIKKSNELIPSTISVAVRRQGYEGYEHILIGIKTILHGVNSEEMIQNVSASLIEKRNLFRFIQWTTGEIKLVKDYILSVDRLRDEAISSRKDSKWWRSLKTKANIGRLRSALGTKDQLIPNCSLVMSMDEVEYLNNVYDLDLLNSMRLVNQLLSTYFLLGFVIVDPASEMSYFFFDGNEDYQTYTFSSLERENSNPQRDLKNMLSIMGGR